MDGGMIRGRVFLLGCLMAALLPLISVASAQLPLELRPNLQPFPAFDLHLGTNFSTGGKQITFSTRSWNSGLGPLELVAGETGSAGQNVYQRVYSSDGSHQDYFAGVFVWHPSHNHFHFGAYALYSLDPVNAPGGSPKSGNKTTFCIMDTTKVDAHLPGAAKKAVYANCNAFVQGMSVGWGDTYGWHLPGQAMDMTGNPDAQYELSVTFDPDNHLLE